jgi:hypothetical protein
VVGGRGGGWFDRVGDRAPGAKPWSAFLLGLIADRLAKAEAGRSQVKPGMTVEEFVKTLGRDGPCRAGRGRYQGLLPAIGPVPSGVNGVSIGDEVERGSPRGRAGRHPGLDPGPAFLPFDLTLRCRFEGSGPGSSQDDGWGQAQLLTAIARYGRETR